MVMSGCRFAASLRWTLERVIHLALGAVVIVLWDIWTKTLNEPVWQIVAEMTSEEKMSVLQNPIY